MQPNEFVDSMIVEGKNLAAEIEKLIKEGNVRHIVVEHEGSVLLEIPITLGVVVGLFAPVLVGLAAIGGVVTRCTVRVTRSQPPGTGV